MGEGEVGSWWMVRSQSQLMRGASTGVPWPWEPMASTAHGHPFSYSGQTGFRLYR